MNLELILEIAKQLQLAERNQKILMDMLAGLRRKDKKEIAAISHQTMEIQILNSEIKKKAEVKNTVWVLTYEVCEYDQNGEYLFAVFNKKPTTSELLQLLCGGSGNMEDHTASECNLVQHIFNGGGRIGTEHFWYHLKEQNVGEQYVFDYQHQL